jgi:PIN domain nuclease of toxin-antitoxin system
MKLILDTHFWIWALNTDSQLLACSWLKTLAND